MLTMILGFGLLYGVLFYAVSGILFFVISSFKLLSNPWTKMMEGKELLVLNLSSPWVMQWFSCKLKAPFAEVDLGGGKTTTAMFDRETIQYMSPPRKGTVQPAVEEINGKEEDVLKLTLPKKDFNSHVFGWDGKPVLIYNSLLKTFLTKDFFADAEKETFMEHGLLYLNQRVNELLSNIRDFTRYTVDLTKPQKSFFANNKIILIIIIVVIGIIGVVFAPGILNSLSKAAPNLLPGAVTNLS